MFVWVTAAITTKQILSPFLLSDTNSTHSIRRSLILFFHVIGSFFSHFSDTCTLFDNDDENIFSDPNLWITPKKDSTANATDSL